MAESESFYPVDRHGYIPPEQKVEPKEKAKLPEGFVDPFPNGVAAAPSSDAKERRNSLPEGFVDPFNREEGRDPVLDNPPAEPTITSNAAAIPEAMAHGFTDSLLAGVQKTSPHTRDPKGDLAYTPLGELVDVDANPVSPDNPYGYKTDKGFEYLDPSKHVVLRDPTSKKMMVFERNPEQVEDGVTGAITQVGRVVSGGLLAGGPRAMLKEGIKTAPGAVELAKEYGVKPTLNMAGKVGEAIEGVVKRLPFGLGKVDDIKEARALPALEQFNASAKTAFDDFGKLLPPDARVTFEGTKAAIAGMQRFDNPELNKAFSSPLFKKFAGLLDKASGGAGETIIRYGDDGAVASVKASGGASFNDAKNLLEETDKIILKHGSKLSDAELEQIGRIRDHIQNDMRAAVGAQGPDAVALFDKVADAQEKKLRDLSQIIAAVKPTAKGGPRSDEAFIAGLSIDNLLDGAIPHAAILASIGGPALAKLVEAPIFINFIKHGPKTVDRVAKGVPTWIARIDKFAESADPAFANAWDVYKEKLREEMDKMPKPKKT